MSALTTYPDPNAETTTVDGAVARDGTLESWAACHDAASGTGAQDSSSQSNMCYVTDGLPTDQKWCYRAIFLYDTSSIGDSDTIGGGEFSAYVTSIYDESLGDASKEYLTICSSNPASNTAIATSDYDYNDFGTTHLTDDVNTFTNTSYNAYLNFPLNTDGKSFISKTGVTKLAMRQGYDISNTEPISSSGYPNNGINGGRWADYSGTNNDPRLSVVYGAATFDSFYPDPNAETTTVDGRVHNDDQVGITWTSVHDATVAVNDGGLGGAFPSQGAPTNWTEGVFSYLYQTTSRGDIARGFVLFDTTAIGSGSTVDSGAFSWFVKYEEDQSDNSAQEYIALVSSTPASNTDLVLEDFDQCGDATDNPTKGATDLTNADFVLDKYNNWTLNATGIGWISKTGVTKLGLREGHDVEDVAPTYGADTNDFYSVAGDFADVSGTGTDPVLSVSYSTGGGVVKRISTLALMGVG